MYLSFTDFMEKKRYRFQQRLWEQDPMYKAKMWKAHRQEYAKVCQFGKYAHDMEQLDEEVLRYEQQVLRIRYESGYLSEGEYEKAIAQLVSQYPGW